MPTKMERFTARARRVLALAQEEAERFQHSYIGTEHLLLGLMLEDGGKAAQILSDLGVDADRVRDIVGKIVQSRRDMNTRLDLTTDVKNVLVMAVDEARRMGQHYIGTEHLLLGFTRAIYSASNGMELMRLL